MSIYKYDNNVLSLRNEYDDLLSKIAKLEFWKKVVLLRIVLPAVFLTLLAFIFNFAGKLILLIEFIVVPIIGFLEYRKFKIVKQVDFNFKENVVIIREIVQNKVRVKKIGLPEIVNISIIPKTRSGEPFYSIVATLYGGKREELIRGVWYDFRFVNILQNNRINVTEFYEQQYPQIYKQQPFIHEKAVNRHSAFITSSKAASKTKSRICKVVLIGFFIFIGILLTIYFPVVSISYWIMLVTLTLIAQILTKKGEIIENELIMIVSLAIFIGILLMVYLPVISIIYWVIFAILAIMARILTIKDEMVIVIILLSAFYIIIVVFFLYAVLEKILQNWLILQVFQLFLVTVTS